MKNYYSVLLFAFICAQFGDSSVWADTVTTRQVVTEGETITVDDNVYSDIASPTLNGGAIYNAGTLTINNGTFTGNFGKNGGAIYNTGTAIINGGSFSGNGAYLNGGAIYSSGTLTINSMATHAVLFENNAGQGEEANDLYLSGQDADNRTVLNLNAAAENGITISDGIVGEFYDVNVNTTGSGQVIVNGLANASSLTINAGTFTSDGAIDVGTLTVNGATTELAVANTLNVMGGTNQGTISGAGMFTIGDGATDVIYNNAGYITKALTITENATLITDANYLLSQPNTAVVNNGVLELTDAALNRAVNGTGLTRINGNVQTTVAIATAMEVLSGKEFVATYADLLGGVVSNAGTLTIGNGALANNITGTAGQTIINGAVIAGNNVSIQNAVTVNSGKSLQIGAGGLLAAVDNSGTVSLDTGTLGHRINGNGETHIVGTVALNNFVENLLVVDSNNQLTTGTANLGNDISNAAGTVVLTGGNLTTSISGAGTTHIAGTVSVTDGEAIANAIVIDGTNILNASANDLGGNIANQSGVLNLNGGTLVGNITGAGTTHILADATVNGTVANNLYFDNTSAVIFGATAAMAEGGKIIANGGSLSFLDDVIETFELQTINLQQDMNIALDMNLADLTADVFNAAYDAQSVDDKWIIISKLNLIDNVTDTIDANTSVHVANGTIGGNIKLADDIEFVNPGDIDSVLLTYDYNATTGGNIMLSYATIENATVSSVADNKTIILGQNVNVDSGTTGVALVGESLTISGANHSITGNGGGVSVTTGQSFTVSNVSNITGFTNTVVNNGGTVSLSSTNFAAANTVDVINTTGSLNLNNVQINAITNGGALTVDGNTTFNGAVTGAGSLLVDAGSILNIGNNTITQDTIIVNGIIRTSALDMGHLTASLIDGDGTLELLNVRSAGLYDLFTGTSTLLVDAGALFNTTNTVDGVLVETKPADEIAVAYDIGLDTATMLTSLANTSVADLMDVGVRMREELLAGNTRAVGQISDSLSPETSAVVQSINTIALDNVSGIANSRMVKKQSKTPITKNVGIWTQGLYSKAKQNNYFGGFTRGIAGGADITLHENKLFGVGYSFAHSDILTSSRDIDVDASTVFLYGQYQLADWYTNLVLDYTVADFTENTEVVDLKIDADYDSKAYGVKVITGYDFADGITPEFGVQYMHIDIAGYKDSVGIRNRFDSSDYMTLIFNTKYARNFKVAPKLTLNPEVHYGVKYDIISNSPDVAVNVPDAQKYTLNVHGLSRVAAELGLSLGAKYRGIDMSLNYDVEIRDEYTAHYGRVRFRYGF